MSFELPEERPASFDETGKHVKLYPAKVTGRFVRLRALVHPAMILLFLLLPWLQINGHQALQLNVADRSFQIFGLFLRGHDAPLLFFLLIGFAISIAFVTAIWGRIWCGWACPQTVFIEGVFRRIEAWIEGDHRRRKALDQGPWDLNKLVRKGAKWLAFLAASLVITHSFLAYFVGSHRVLEMILRPPSENWTSFLVICFTTAVILFDFGWFREQFCVVMCPYGRFQSVMLDEESMAVAYDSKRGEPRRGAVLPGQTQGDCVNCYRCVQVCPTGVDIRRGLQLECIACTACIDACDEVMEKIQKPKGLIRYASQAELAGKKVRFLRPRTLIYLAIMSSAFIGLTILVALHKPLSLAVLRAKDAPYQSLPQADGSNVITNHFILESSNQDHESMEIDLRPAENSKKFEIVIPLRPIQLEPKQQRRTDFFIRFLQTEIKGGIGVVDLEVWKNGVLFSTEKVKVVGPNR